MRVGNRNSGSNSASSAPVALNTSASSASAAGEPDCSSRASDWGTSWLVWWIWGCRLIDTYFLTLVRWVIVIVPPARLVMHFKIMTFIIYYYLIVLTYRKNVSFSPVCWWYLLSLRVEELEDTWSCASERVTLPSQSSDRQLQNTRCHRLRYDKEFI